MTQWQVCFQSIVADVQARHFSERSEQEEEELVTQAVTSKESKEIKVRADQNRERLQKKDMDS